MNRMPRLNSTTHTVLGVIKQDDSANYTESTVALSEKSFRTLLTLIPRGTEGHAVTQDIRRIKDTLTNISFETGRTRANLVEILNEELSYQAVMADIITFEQTPDVKIVGKIELP